MVRSTDGRPVDHFELHRLKYKEVPTGIEAKKVEKPKDIQKLNLRPQRDAPEDTEYLSVSDITRKVVLTTLVTETYYPLSEVVADVRRRMKVQVLPGGWRATCVEHGELASR